jgi:hypothetical protein
VGSVNEFILWQRDGFKSPGERSNIAHLMGERKLNLGCGPAPEPAWNGWVNVDLHRHTAANLIFDMRDPWPIRDASFNTIFSTMVLHCFSPGDEIFHVLAESWRVLKPCGYFIATIPEGHAGNPMHKSVWSERTPHLLVRSVYTESGLVTTCWDQGLPIKNWILKGVEKPDLIWFVLQKPES